MATDIFTLLGTISVDVKDFNSKLDAAIQKVNQLASALSSVNGMSVNPSVNVTQNGGTASGSTSGVSGYITGSSSGSGTASGGSSTSSGGSTSGGSTKGGLAATNGYSGTGYGDGNYTYYDTASGGWTIADGVEANLVSQMLSDAFRQLTEMATSGDERLLVEEQTVAKMMTMLGLDHAEAEALLGEITQFGRDTPLDMDTALGVAAQMLAYGENEETLIDSMTMLGDLAMGDSSIMSRIAKAYMQVKGKNTLQMQEAYQFTEAYIPLFDLLKTYYDSDEYAALVSSEDYAGRADNRGLTASELQGYLNDIFAPRPVYVEDEDVEAALRLAVSPEGNYYNAMATMMDSRYGLKQRVDENWTLMLAEAQRVKADIEENFILPKLVEKQEKWLERLETFNAFVDALVAGEDIGEFIPGIAAARELNHKDKTIPERKDGDGMRHLINDAILEYVGQVPSSSGLRGAAGSVFADYESEGYRTKYVQDGLRNRLLTHDYTDIPETGGIGGSAGAFNAMIQPMMAQMETSVGNAVREGMSGITITGEVTTGSVVLNTGTLVGALTPKINLQLGILGNRSNRG